ncbi:MAG: hypothetical protein GY928_03895 [Colwellia sp.]|nr:hypothetical protein [Colwellia sp.]
MSLQIQAVKAVLEQANLSVTEFQDVASHGADCGTSGFIYYTETEAFYNNNEELINSMLEENKEEFGNASIFEMISGFGRASDLEVETEYLDIDDSGDLVEIDFTVEVVHAVECFDSMEVKAFAKDTQYKNLMAWYVLEEASRYIEHLIENEEFEEVKSLGIDCADLED